MKALRKKTDLKFDTHLMISEPEKYVDKFLDAGSEIVVLGRYRGVARETGKELDAPFVHVWTVEDGKAVRFRQFLDTVGWVEALSP